MGEIERAVTLTGFIAFAVVRGHLSGRHTDMDVRHPDIAIFGFLVPNVDYVVARPHAIGFAQAHAFADPWNGRKTDACLVLVGLVLDFDFYHGASCPWVSKRLDRQE